MLSTEQESEFCWAAEFAAQELAETGEIAHFDRDGWEKCAEAGLVGMIVPREYGGQGKSLSQFVSAMAGAGYATHRLGVLFAVGAQVFGTVCPLIHAGNEEQKRRFLPALARGAWVAAHAVTEPAGGSDLGHLQSTARQDGSDWVIDGSKYCITCASAADVIVVYARSSLGLICLIVEPGTPGIRLKPLKGAGLAGCGLGTIEFEAVRVPQANVLGRPGAGEMLFQGSIERERACILAFAVGAMQRQLELAVRFATKRIVGGVPIGKHQSVSHRIADMRVRLDVSQLLLYRAAELKSLGRRAPLESAVAKLAISENFLQNSTDLFRILGSQSFQDSSEARAAQRIQDALGGLLLSGTNDIQRNIIAGQLGLPVA